MAIKSYIGEIYGTFKVSNDLGMKPGKKTTKIHHYVICECLKCGIQSEGMLSNLKRLHKKCDCDISVRSMPHWKRINTIYRGMKSRCANEKDKKYKMYGRKGIKVCDDWINSCRPFGEWALKNGYADNLTIDRIDSSKGYNPENCRWVTLEQNGRYTKKATPISKILEVKELLKKGHKRRDISNLVGVSYDVVTHIDKGIRWADVV